MCYGSLQMGPSFPSLLPGTLLLHLVRLVERDRQHRRLQQQQPAAAGAEAGGGRRRRWAAASEAGAERKRPAAASEGPAAATGANADHGTEHVNERNERKRWRGATHNESKKSIRYVPSKKSK